MPKLSRKLQFIVLYSISMAMLEAAVVIYLRMIFFPSHFDLPQIKVPPLVMSAELSRELATILMLICIGYFTGHNKATRFAWFMIAFAIWDIFYYVFLYAFLHWPSSILGWDILFLIPVPWYGPVLTPILVSLTMTGFAASILYAQSRTYVLKTNLKERLTMLAGCAVILFTYTSDFILYAYKMDISVVFAFTLFTPETYNWTLFFVGIGLILTAILSFLRRIKRADAEAVGTVF